MQKKTHPDESGRAIAHLNIINLNVSSCRGRGRTSTEQLGRQRLDFILFSPPSRPEGMSANFITLHS